MALCGCVATGQTASGKTHTLMGTPDEPGIIPLSVRSIFGSIAEASYSNVVVRVSYIEVYNEELRDLFSMDMAAGAKLRIVENVKTGPWVHGAVQAVAASADHALSLLAFGESQRSYGATNMNDHSSRSHVLFRMTIKRGFTSDMAGSGAKSLLTATHDEYGSVVVDETGPAWEEDAQTAVRISALNFVDLAGSERLKKTGATGQALKEANAINTSLMTLGTVIAKLSAGDEKAHIPYRDSKLTHLLSASLGGNSLTTMVACISPEGDNREETVNTLRYAVRASKIVTDGAVNEVDNLDGFVGSYKAEIKELKAQLAASWEDNRLKEEDLEKYQEMVEEYEARGGDAATLEAVEQRSEERLAELAGGFAVEREELLKELDLTHEKLEEERRRNTKDGDRDMEQQRQLWEDEMRLVEDAAEAQRAELQQQLEAERAAAAAKTEQLVTQVSQALSGDMSVVHATLVDEVKRQKAEIDRLNALAALGSAGEGGSAASLTQMLVVAERQLKDAQFQVTKLRGELVRAQQEAVLAGRAMAEELNALRKELRGFAAAHVEHSNFDVPDGYVLWFHAHSLPRIFALAAPENAHVLLRPHASAPVAARNLPLGATVEIDVNAVAVARRANPLLHAQLARLVPASLSEKTFWLHYFSHVHAIKGHIASQARARAAQMAGVVDAQLRETFLAVLSEGILIRRHEDDGSVLLVKLWLSGKGTLSMLGDGESEPSTLSLRDIVKVAVGKGADEAGHEAVEELSFALITRLSRVRLEASARLERQALVEGFCLLVD